MKIEAVDDSVFVCVSQKDMEEMAVTYEEFSSSAEKSKCVIDKILLRVNEMTGKTFSRFDSLHIEVLPDCQGGCLMIFSFCDADTPYQMKEEMLFETKNINDIIDFSSAVYSRKIQLPKAKLYMHDSTFRLLLFVENKEIFFIAKEFLNRLPLSPYIKGETFEKFKKIGDDRALDVFFCKTSQS